MKFTTNALAVVTALAAPFLASGEVFFLVHLAEISSVGSAIMP